MKSKEKRIVLDNTIQDQQQQSSLSKSNSGPNSSTIGSRLQSFLRLLQTIQVVIYKGHCPRKILDQLTPWQKQSDRPAINLCPFFSSLHLAFLLFYDLTFSFLTGTPPSQWQEQSDQGSINLEARM